MVERERKRGTKPKPFQNINVPRYSDSARDPQTIWNRVGGHPVPWDLQEGRQRHTNGARGFEQVIREYDGSHD